MNRNPMHAAYTILGLILHHCPTGKEQAFMAKKYGEIVRQIYTDFETNHDIEGEKVMAGILLDGLKHGNWPWSLPEATPVTNHRGCMPDCAADHSVTSRPN